MKTKEQIDKEIDKGVNPGFWAEMGCFRVSFHPFENTLTEEEETLYKKIMAPDAEDIAAYGDDLKIFAESIYSTVYRGYRWYFETPEKLKEFCKIVGQL